MNTINLPMNTTNLPCSEEQLVANIFALSSSQLYQIALHILQLGGYVPQLSSPKLRLEDDALYVIDGSNEWVFLYSDLNFTHALKNQLSPDQWAEVQYTRGYIEGYETGLEKIARSKYSTRNYTEVDK